MPVTIKDVAKRAEVSHSTVSRALTGNRLISDVTTERVRRIAQEMGYHPSAAARSLKTRQTKALGVVVRNIDDPFFSEILQGIEDVAQRASYSLFISSSQNDTDRERSVIQAMREHRVDGIIICSTSFSTSQSQQLLEYGVPIVAVNNQAAEEYRYSISHDDEDGCRQLTRHLIDLGHRRIAYLGNSQSGRTTLDRLSGFHKEMDAARLPIPATYIHQVPGGAPESGQLGLDHYLSLVDRPTALVCFNDMMAIGALNKPQTIGIRVPEEFSVTGFDNIFFSAYTNPPLTTFDQPKHYIGAEAARLLLELLPVGPEDLAPALKSQTLKGRLLVRQSTASPPSQY
jgi:DNA-binding LacI/PurR family transcriptional regulator